MKRTTLLCLAASAGLTLATTQAHAQPAAPPPDEARGWETRPGTEPEDVALLVPRLVLTPPRLVLKAVFWPIQKGLRFFERHALGERYEDLLYNDERDSAIVPVLAFQTSLGPSVGLKIFDGDLGGHGERIEGNARFGGRYQQAYEVGFDADRILGTRYWVQTQVRYEIEPRLLFFGFGTPPEQASGSSLDPREAAVATRFRQSRFLALGRLGYTFGDPGRLAKVGVTGILNRRNFGPGDGPEPSIESVYDTERVPGFEDGARTLELNGNFVLDTRDLQGRTSSGVYLDLFGGGVPNLTDTHYFHYGGEGSLYIDLYRHTRVLVLRAAHEAARGADANIPFTDLPRLGGANRLRGHVLDRFRDKTTLVTTAEYHYPIHEYVAGSLFVDGGHASRGYDDLFDFKEWRAGAGGGFIFRSKKSVIFTLDVAYGDGVQVYFTTDPLRAFDGRNDQL